MTRAYGYIYTTFSLEASHASLSEQALDKACPGSNSRLANEDHWSFGVSPFQQVLSQQHHPHEPHPENEVSSSIPILRHAFESWKCLTFDVVVEVLRKRGLQYVECVKMAGV